LLLLQPELIVLDEIDLDIDEESLECIMLMIKRYLEETDKSIILITNNKKLLDNITPNCVHILVDGTIRETGGTELYKRIVEDGNSQFS
jgi:Fe-S cluster assembly ATP-binding protein